MASALSSARQKRVRFPAGGFGYFLSVSLYFSTTSSAGPTAHKSLPFGTCLVIGNPKTGRKVAVRLNDRGPFTPGVMLDLSSGAAEAIGMRSTHSVTMRRC
ncbi:MAG: septal ring lytic transglycosylase RlpA family protein [Methyloceanibacter sp.]